jgi:ornithine cyclodeaminase/alanine dehydrogenase-like protein (mu-crystallin family)
VEAAEVLITATTARESIVRGEWLRPGQHVTAVGADDNTKCGLDVLCLQRANRFTERTFERSSKTTIYGWRCKI